MMVDAAIQKVWFSLLLLKELNFWQLSGYLIQSPSLAEVGKGTEVVACFCLWLWNSGFNHPFDFSLWVVLFIYDIVAYNAGITEGGGSWQRARAPRHLVCVPLALLGELPNIPNLLCLNSSHRSTVPIWWL